MICTHHGFMPSRAVLVILLALSALAQSGRGQGVLHTFTGVATDGYASSIGGPGDIDGDGFPDVAVGAPKSSTLVTAGGRLVVHSGRSGSLLLVIHGPHAGDNLGVSFDSAGDVDLDGTPDILIGAERKDNPSAFGEAVVVSGASGMALRAYSGATSADLFGHSVATAGDFDGDGVGDHAVGAPSVGGPGRAYVYSGATGGQLWTGTGTASFGFAHYGYVVRGSFDIDTDGFDDLLVGLDAPAGLLTGYVDVVLGGAAPIAQVFAPSICDNYVGRSVSPIDDVDADGYPDVALGLCHPLLSCGGDFVKPWMQVRSGKTGSAIWSHGFEGMGVAGAWAPNPSVDAIGDINGDGVAEIVVGSPTGYPLADTVFILDGKTGTELDSFSGPDGFGMAVRAVGDVNGDAEVDFMVSRPSASAPYAVTVTPTCGDSMSYGQSCPGSGGVLPSLLIPGCPTPGGGMSYRLKDAMGGSIAITFIGVAPAAVTLPNGCQLLVDPSLAYTFAFGIPGVGPGSGAVSISTVLPVPSPLITLYVQAFVLDPGAMAGYSATNGVEINIE